MLLQEFETTAGGELGSTPDRDFSVAYKVWQSACFDAAGLGTINGDVSDEMMDAVCDGPWTTYRELVATPCTQPHHLLEKLAALEHSMMEARDGGDWADGRDFMMLASLKVDLLRFRIEQV